jgi:tRNA(adenine34) deaminase
VGPSGSGRQGYDKYRHRCERRRPLGKSVGFFAGRVVETGYFERDLTIEVGVIGAPNFAEGAAPQCGSELEAADSLRFAFTAPAPRPPRYSRRQAASSHGIRIARKYVSTSDHLSDLGEVRIMARKKGNKKYWSHNVKTVSTFPPEGLFTKDAATIARKMASKKVSPKGIGSGIRMIQFFINRAGKNLPAKQKKQLEKAKRILQERVHKQKEKSS